MTASHRRDVLTPHRAIDLVPPFADRWRREPRSVRVICPRLGLSFLIAEEIGGARCACGDLLHLVAEVERLEGEPWRHRATPPEDRLTSRRGSGAGGEIDPRGSDQNLPNLGRSRPVPDTSGRKGPRQNARIRGIAADQRATGVLVR